MMMFISLICNSYRKALKRFLFKVWNIWYIGKVRWAFHLICRHFQKLLILLLGLIDEMFKWCKDSVARPHPHLLRFMAHLVLFFRALGITGGTEKVCFMLQISVFQFYSVSVLCGLRGCKNRSAPFPGQMSYKATKPGLVCLSYLSMLYYCIVVY